MRRMERMSRLRDYKVEKGIPDPRGWKVVDGEGHHVGVVRDLVIDTDRLAAAFVDVELDAKTFELRDDPHVLVPMRRAQRDGGERRLVVPELTPSRVTALYEARAEHEARFWDEWWHAIEHPASADLSAETTPRLTRPPDAASPIPGDVVRTADALPPVDDDPGVDRRPGTPDERMVARERDEFFDRRRFDER